MNIKQDTTVVRSATATAQHRTTATTSQSWISSRRIKQLVQRLPESAPCVVARAPGRLNVMGGIAEYTGSLVLNMPAQDVVTVAIQPRASADLSFLLGADDDFIVPLSLLHDDQNNWVSVEHGKSLVRGDDVHLNRCVLGTLVELQRAKIIPELSSGLTVALDRIHPGVFGYSEYISIISALTVALAGMVEVDLELHDAINICKKVQNDWLDLPAGMTDAMCCLQGESFVLGGMRSEPCTLDGSVPLNDGLRFIGIDCGSIHEDLYEKFHRVRSASDMGRVLIDRIVKHDGMKGMQWNGSMSCVSVNDFVERFRDRIPLKMKGRDYLERFGDMVDPQITINPDYFYKIRSRTEHHIYEHTRCRQLMECLSRWTRSKDNSALVDAEAAMYASHWSYGQRCGLGSIETDLLVNLIRRHGADVEIHGAKITGHGCGGMVTVLIQPTKEALEALDYAINDYITQTGLQVTMIDDSSPGAMITGAHQLVI